MRQANLQGGDWTTNPMHEPPACPVDFEQILQVTDGDEEFVQDLIDIYTDDTPRQLDALRAGLEALDLRAVEEAAHKMKGSSSNMGFWKVEVLAFLLLSMAREGQIVEGELILERMEYENGEALRMLEHALATHQMIATSSYFRETVQRWADHFTAQAVPLRQALNQWDLPRLAQMGATLEANAQGVAFWECERAACGLRYAAEQGEGEHMTAWIRAFEQGVARLLGYLKVRR